MEQSEVNNSKNSNTNLRDLPDYLIHQIMYRLPYEESAKFSVLSKSYYSAWLSFPALDFTRSAEYLPYPAFFNRVKKILQLRGPYLKGSLDKLRLSYVDGRVFLDFQQYLEVFDMLLHFAVKNNVNELDLNIDGPIYVNYDSLRPLLSSPFLTVLKLTGVKVFPSVHVFITCPKLNELVFDCCDGFRSINISSSSSLEKVEVKCCRGLRAFQISEGRSLNSFKFEGFEGTDRCDIELPTSNSLRYLHLTNGEVSANMYSKVVPHVEFLHIHSCNMPKIMRLRSPHIKVLEMKKNYRIERLILSTPNLDKFLYEASETTQQCTLDISDCLALRVLKLIKATAITDEWLNQTIEGLCHHLEELEISNCNVLEKMGFENYDLKKLSLYECLELKEVVVDVPNLIEFYYSGKIICFPISISSAKCSANISLPNDLSNISPLNDFLESFNHFKNLSLSCATFEYMIFPEKILQGKNSSPLYDLMDLKLEVINDPLPHGQTLKGALNILLCLMPKPKSITLYSQSTNTTRTLRFRYGKEVKAKNNTRKRGNCCYNVPIKCWRHYKVDIEYQGFDKPLREFVRKFLARQLLY